MTDNNMLSKFQEKYQNDPIFREKQKERQRSLRRDPDFIKKQKEYRARPEVREKKK